MLQQSAFNFARLQHLLMCFAANHNPSLTISRSLCCRCKWCLKRLQVKPAVVHKPAVQTCLQVQAGHTHVVWCCSASSHACMSLQANDLVKNTHRCHPQLYSHCNCVCKSTSHTTASARGALCHCYRHSLAGQRPAHHTQAGPPPARSTSSHWAIWPWPQP